MLTHFLLLLTLTRDDQYHIVTSSLGVATHLPVPKQVVKGSSHAHKVLAWCRQRYKSAKVVVIMKVDVSPLDTGNMLTGDK